MEQLNSFVSSRGLLKHCHRSNAKPQSSSHQIDDNLTSDLGDGHSIYVCTDALEVFVENFLPGIKSRFVLVSGDSDRSIDQNFLASPTGKRLLSHPLLLKWHAQNLLAEHASIDHLPIGLDYHTQWESPGVWGISKISPISQETMIREVLAKARNFQDRYPKAYCNWHFAAKYGDRIACYQNIDKSCCFFEPYRLPRKFAWTRQTEFMFTLSPSGIGPDCHRTWETLILGSVPIIRASPLSPLFSGLPVLVVRAWSDLTPEKLKQAAEALRTMRFDFSPLFLRYWADRIAGISKPLLEALTLDEFQKLIVNSAS